MDRNETLKILSLIKVAFPNSYNKMSEDELKALTMLWETQFKDYEFEMVAIATNTYISEDLSGYAPTIAQVKNIARKLTSPQTKTDNEIWMPIYKAICNSGYNSKEEWKKLPQDLQKCCTPEQLKVWAMSSNEDVQWIKKEVVSEYRQQETRQQEYDLLPNKAQVLLGLKDENI